MPVFKGKGAKMKVLVVSNMYPSETYPSYGIFVKHFCEQLDCMNISYSLAVMKKGSNKISKVWNYLVFYLESFFKAVLVKYDVIYVHYASHSSQAVLLAKKIKKLKIYTNVHGSDVVPENKGQEKMQRYTRKILECSEKIITPSLYFREIVATKYGIDKERIYVTPSGGIDKKVFYKVGEKEYSNELKIGYVGRISYKKGWDTLVKACAELKIPYKLILVGDGPEKNQLDQLLQTYQLENKVDRKGLLNQNQLREVYNDIDIFVFPTEREGESLGLVAIEAMACGTPVIASDYAAPAYYVEDGVNGYKYQMGDCGELAERITFFYSLSHEERKNLAIGAINTAKKYDKESAISDLALIIKGRNNE